MFFHLSLSLYLSLFSLYLSTYICTAQGQVLHCKGRNLSCSSAKDRSSTANSEPRLQSYQELNRCDSFPLLSASHSLFSISTDLKRSGKIPGASTWRWGEWIWLIGPSGLHRNSPQVLNITSTRAFDQIRDPEIPIAFRAHIYIGCQKCVHSLTGGIYLSKSRIEKPLC